MDFPQFTFEGLPDCFKASADGVISGIPQKLGSYTVLIRYASGNQRDQKEVIIRITPSPRDDSNFKSDVISQSVKTAGRLVINYPTK